MTNEPKQRDIEKRNEGEGGMWIKEGKRRRQSINRLQQRAKETDKLFKAFCPTRDFPSLLP